MTPEESFAKMAKHIEVMNHNSTETAKQSLVHAKEMKKQTKILERQTDAFEDSNKNMNGLIQVIGSGLKNDRFDKLVILGLIILLGLVLGFDLTSKIGGLL